MIDWNKVKELRVNGYTNKQIQITLGISRGSIQRIIRNIKKGIKRNKINNSELIYKRLKISEDEYVKLLNKLYWDDNLSQQKIADKLDVHVTSIENNFLKYDIKTRSISEASIWQQKLCNLTNIQVEVLDGLMLGDGHLDYSNVSARITYGCKFKNTLIDISKEFSQLHFSNPWGSKISDNSWRTKNKYWHFKSSFYNDLLFHRNRWYKNVKIIPNDINLTPKSFYWWFIGDGYTMRKCVALCTDCFDNDSINKLKSKLNCLGYDSSITVRNRLKLSRDSSIKFINIIENNNSIAQEFKYKFDRFHEE